MKTADGETFSGRLENIDSQWNLRFKTSNGRRVLPAEDIVRWGERRAARRAPMVLLADGSALHADVMRLESDHLVLESTLWGRLSLPLAVVRGVVFRFFSEHAPADRLLANIARSDARRDTLFLTNGEQVVGSLAPTVGPSNIRDTPLEIFLLETDEGRVFIPAARIAAVRFNPALVREPKTGGLRVTFGFREGSWLQVAALEKVGKQTTLVLAAGVRLEADSLALLKALTFLQTTGGRVVYLSDLSAVSYKHIPFFQQTWKYGRNQNLFGGRLRVGREVFAKGISMHSTSRLAYRVPRGATAFDAELALDQTAHGGGSVRFRVYLLDADAAWRVAAESPVVRGGAPTVRGNEAALSLHVELKGARALALIVDFADQGDRQDHADWLNARFILTRSTSGR